MHCSETKPLITFALMAYNSVTFIKDAIEGAFSQTYQPLEVIISDDCSSDGTYDIIQEMAAQYRGTHRVVVNRNDENVGVSGHINRIMEICRGEIIVIAAADDISSSNRVEKVFEAYAASGGKAFSVHSSCILIDESGAETGMAQEYDSYETDLESVVENGTWLYGCTHAWHRDVFDRFGPLPTSVKQEDEVIPFRSLLLGTISYIKEPVVRYRLHGSNISAQGRRIAESEDELQQLRADRFRQRLENLQCYLADLEKVRESVDTQRGQQIRDRLLKNIRNCELELVMHEGTPAEKLEVLKKGLQQGAHPRQLLSWVFHIAFSKVCKSYAFYKYKKSVNQISPFFTLKKDDSPL